MRLSQICIAITQLARGAGAWSPLALWPDGIDTPGMWISPRDLTSQWADYTGTTPVSVPGTVADASNPVGLALDIRAGAPEVLGPEIIDGTPDSIAANWTNNGDGTYTSNGSGYLEWYGLSANKVYYIEFRIVSISSGSLGEVQTIAGKSSIGTYTGYTIGATGLAFYANSFVGVADSFSARELPGLHMLQSTSAARPLASARVNLLTYTEDFAAFDWASKQFMTVDSDAIPPPSGFTSVDKLIGTADSQVHRLLKSSVVGLATVSWVVKSAELRRCALLLGTPFAGAWFDSTSGTCGVLTDYPDTVDQSIEDLGGGFYRCSVTSNVTASNGNGVQFILMPDGATSFAASGVAMDGLGLYATGAQFNYGGATDYQSVPGDGSTYASGPPIAQLYDGVDDGMATAAFSAGTLIDGMDCLIPVRRDSAASCVAGLYNGIADATKFFGMAESASGSGCVGSGAGTPTVWVDNTQLTGGTAVTRGTLHTALTVGDWHILEFRNLDLSTWTAAGFGLYTSYVFPGARGDILLFPSTASTEDKDAARQYLADYYGVTLP